MQKYLHVNLKVMQNLYFSVFHRSWTTRGMNPPKGIGLKHNYSGAPNFGHFRGTLVVGFRPVQKFGDRGS
jgi:hypothetical protein